jgi:hypothetical protein
MAASISRAQALAEKGDPTAKDAIFMADLFCRASRHKVAKLFRDLWRNDDARKYKAGVAVMEGRHAWIEEGTIPVAEHHVGAAAAPHAAAPAKQPVAVR